MNCCRIAGKPPDTAASRRWDHQTLTENRPISRGRTAILAFLSSGLVVAAIGATFTLTGVLYRAGWLAGFSVNPEMFLPESATEIAFWAYFACAEVWNDIQKRVWTLVMFVGGVCFLGCLVGLLCTYLVMKHQRKVRRARAITRVLNRRPMARAATASLFAVITACSTPLIALSIVALAISLPLPAYLAGVRNAESFLKKYPDLVQAGDCHRIRIAGSTIGQCPYVIAQGKEKIAFLDGGSAYILTGKDIEVSWLLERPAK